MFIYVDVPEVNYHKMKLYVLNFASFESNILLQLEPINLEEKKIDLYMHIHIYIYIHIYTHTLYI